MTTAAHVYEELPALLRGEADRATVSSAAAHLRECEDCRQELISALLAHAALASAARYAPDLAAMLAGPAAEPAGDAGDEPPPAAAAQPDPALLPDFGPILASVRADRPPGPARPPRAFRPRWLAAAAVVGIGLGVGGVAAADALHTGPSARTVQLAAFGTGTVPATAKIVGGHEVKVDAAALPTPGPDRLYEVWLTNKARTQMYAVGSLPAGRTGTFTVAPALLHTYSALEVSVQPLSDSGYSGVSVLRGTYG